MAVGSARKSGFQVDEKTAAQQVKANVFGLEKLRDNLHQGFFVPVGDIFGPVVVSYMLVGLDAEHYKPDLNTDAVGHVPEIASIGRWPVGRIRPPTRGRRSVRTISGRRRFPCARFSFTRRKRTRPPTTRSIQLAAAWMAKAQPRNNDDRGWRVLGLAWAGKDKDATQKAMRELLAAQRADGGWSDLDSMESSAYATGKALFALQTAGLSRRPMRPMSAASSSC